MKILSIDAWAVDEPRTWEWNQWYNVGEISKEEFEKLNSDKKILHYMKRNGYITTANKRKVVVEDDQYNKTICDRSDYRPLFAIEYGPEY